MRILAHTPYADEDVRVLRAEQCADNSARVRQRSDNTRQQAVHRRACVQRPGTARGEPRVGVRQQEPIRQRQNTGTFRKAESPYALGIHTEHISETEDRPRPLRPSAALDGVDKLHLEHDEEERQGRELRLP